VVRYADDILIGFERQDSLTSVAKLASKAGLQLVGSALLNVCVLNSLLSSRSCANVGIMIWVKRAGGLGGSLLVYLNRCQTKKV